MPPGLRVRVARARDTTTHPAVLAAFRALLIARNLGAAARRPRAALRFLVRSREVTNLTYELANMPSLVKLVASVLEVEPAAVERCVAELHDDEELRAAIRGRLSSRRNRDHEPRYGKRYAIYSIVRLTRPGIVIETGTHDGLGSTVIARALERNALEGAEGHLHTFDINPESGWLIEVGHPRVTRHLGDVRETLPQVAAQGVDVLVQDSAKILAHERWEFTTALSSPGGALVMYSDDVSATGALPELCRQLSARYGSFREEPLGHFWPGNEIGLARARR
jgi:predicted O-methyltransferase YrrM